MIDSLRFVGAFAVVTVALPAAAVPSAIQLAGAEDAQPGPPAAQVAERDVASSDDASRADVPPSEASDRAFSFVPDPRLARPLGVIGSYAASYATTEAAARPLAALANHGGLVSELGAELGLWQRLSATGDLRLAPGVAGESPRNAGRIYLRGLLTEPGARVFRLSLHAGYSRDFTPAAGPFAEATASVDVGRVRLGALAHAEKMFAEGRDGVDLFAAAGASVRIVEPLRLGAEYVGQDFEDAWEPEEAEGGIRHFAALTLAAAPTERVSIVLGPAIGLAAPAPHLLGRAAISYRF